MTISVYNILGREIKTLVDNELMSAGDNVVTWDGKNNDGRQVSSGVYFYRIEAGELTATRKMLIMK